uniref:Uncharacterized protein n=1 Tax=Arundo donax TaxID=35708 RepID=A0A0A8Z8Y5_ARUDO
MTCLLSTYEMLSRPFAY